MWQAGFLRIGKGDVTTFFLIVTFAPLFVRFFFFFSFSFLALKTAVRNGVHLKYTQSHKHFSDSTASSSNPFHDDGVLFVLPAGVQFLPYEDFFFFFFFSETLACVGVHSLSVRVLLFSMHSKVTPFYPRSWARFLHRTEIVKPLAKNRHTALNTC